MACWLASWQVSCGKLRVRGGRGYQNGWLTNIMWRKGVGRWLILCSGDKSLSSRNLNLVTFSFFLSR